MEILSSLMRFVAHSHCDTAVAPHTYLKPPAMPRQCERLMSWLRPGCCRSQPFFPVGERRLPHACPGLSPADYEEKTGMVSEGSDTTSEIKPVWFTHKQEESRDVIATRTWCWHRSPWSSGVCSAESWGALLEETRCAS